MTKGFEEHGCPNRHFGIQDTEKDYNAYDTVIISENHTVCSNKRNTECYIYKNFKDINKDDVVFLLAFYNF